MDHSGNLSVGADVTGSFAGNYDSGTGVLTVSAAGSIDYAFVVTFTTTITDKTKTSFVNEASLLTDGSTVLDSDTATVSTPRGKTITKKSNGIHNWYDNNYVTWQIDINTEAETITGPLVDTVGSGIEVDTTSIKVSAE